jgi:hypothetical protein
MNLSEPQHEFLSKEFNLSQDSITSFGIAELRELREKCFDIEVEEVVFAERNGLDVLARGETAAELVDFLYDRLISMKSAKPGPTQSKALA